MVMMMMIFLPKEIITAMISKYVILVFMARKEIILFFWQVLRNISDENPDFNKKLKLIFAWRSSLQFLPQLRKLQVHKKN